MLPVINENCNSIPDEFVEIPNNIGIDKKLDIMRDKAIKMGYRFVGRHSAVKVCKWSKDSIRGKNFCYKKKFYGIESNQCVQMTPVMFFCNFNCRHCWRNFDYIMPREKEQWDKPEDIINGCISAQTQFLQGFRGNPDIDKKKFNEAMKPRHFAISLSGEPTLYPYLPEFIDRLKTGNITAFLVTNGTNPDMIESLLSHEPTNLYVSFYGTTPEMYQKAAVPMIKDFWPRVLNTLYLIKQFECNTVFRLTLVKGINFMDPKGYAKFIEDAQPKFVECKAFMAVGGSRKSMKYADMPLHSEMQDFAAVIEQKTSYKIIDEKADSRVVLLARK